VSNPGSDGRERPGVDNPAEFQLIFQKKITYRARYEWSSGSAADLVRYFCI